MELIELPWLRENAEPVKTTLSNLAVEVTSLGPALFSLCNQKLKPNEVSHVARFLRKRMEDVSKAPEFSSFKLGLLSNSTYDLYQDDMAVGAARHQIALQIISADYDQVVQEVMNPDSGIYKSGLDAVLVALDHTWFGFQNGVAHETAAGQLLENAKSQLGNVLSAIRQHSRLGIILQTIPVPPLSILGSFDSQVTGSIRRLITRLNTHILDIALTEGFYILDVDALSQLVGQWKFFDDKQWHAYKLPFSTDCAALYGEWLGRLLGAIRGKSRKVLVLDLDNTLWSGVIGDDGIEGIRIGNGSAEGEAHLSLQKYAKACADHGIILAVASKNDFENAKLPFRLHPDMHLRESDIIFFKANWEPKHENLAAMAQEIGVGIDSMIFMDDNAAERAQMRAYQPMVAVPELTSDPSDYLRLLSMAGYFESVSLSEEDKGRNRSYAAEQLRNSTMSAWTNPADYLSQLEMKIEIADFDAMGRQRIAQLINKSNQFNLTTRRYSESDVEKFEIDADVVAMQVRLSDKFGDFGMIGVIIATPSMHQGKKAMLIDSWLMSCRVLGRRVEDAMLSSLVEKAKAKGAVYLLGHYVPTPKNGMVSQHYEKLGFTLLEERADATKHYVLDCTNFDAPTLPHLPTRPHLNERPSVGLA
jgi:FkbH-like protein